MPSSRVATALIALTMLPLVSTSRIELVKWEAQHGGTHTACSIYVDDVWGCTGWTTHLSGEVCWDAYEDIDCGKFIPRNDLVEMTPSRHNPTTQWQSIYDHWSRGPFKMKAPGKEPWDKAVNVTPNWVQGSVEVENNAGDKASCWLPRGSGGSGYKEWRYEDRLARGPFAQENQEDDVNYIEEVARAYEDELEKVTWSMKEEMEDGRV